MNFTSQMISPGLSANLNSYWAMHFCAVFESLYQQKTIEFGFQLEYMNEVFPSIENLISKSGPSFFIKIKSSLQNFGLQTFLAHFLLSKEGEPITKMIIHEVLAERKMNVDLKKFQYGVFVSAKDFASSAQFITNHNPILITHPGVNFSEAGKSIAYADICILLKSEEESIGILGEIEGNRAHLLYRESFWKRKNGAYFSFGIGVRQRIYHHNMFQEPPSLTYKWEKIGEQNFLIIEMSSDYYVVGDFYSAIGTIETLFTMGKNQRLALNFEAQNIVRLIRDSWDDNILDLLTKLRELIVYSETTLGTNPLGVTSAPKIII